MMNLHVSGPLVSVIVPVYNGEKYLEKTLESILASTYNNIEIILVDDGSTDNSLKIARQYAAKYRNIICISQPNKGVSAARNNAIRNAGGMYILPVDADDLISDTFIEEAIGKIHGDSTVKVVTPSAFFIGDRTGPWTLHAFSLRLLARKNMIPVTSLFRKEDWKKAGGYNEKVGREDWVFWISVLRNGGKVVKLENIGLYYRIHANSKRKKDRKLLQETIHELNRLYPDFFFSQLNGPLRQQRSLSRVINTFYNILPRSLYPH